ncbi:MAG: DUF6850 family outer membrane beta-barrel protein [Ignavibacteriales bacterium]
MKNIILTSLTVIMLSASAGAQQFYEPESMFRTIFEAGASVNSYSNGGNPAFLKWDHKGQLLSIQSSYSNSDGEFRRFLDPGTSRLYQLSAAGKKEIDSFQVFKGKFGFQRLERDKWSWLATKDYQNFNPFLFGDSTTGRTHYNGILMNAEYSAFLTERILAGFRINYAVDEGLKEVAPRPTTKHRDIDLTLGGGYLLGSSASIGAMVRIYDFNERINYKEDEGAVTKEILLIKFRGFDYPYVNKKKVEERQSYQNGLTGFATFSFELPAGISAAAYMGGGIEQFTVKDDALDPKSEGFWKNRLYEAGLQSSIAVSSRMKAGLYYCYKNNDMWARHSLYSVLFMENTSASHSVLAGAEYSLNSNVKVGVEAGVENFRMDYSDYYSDLSWSTKGNKYSVSAGAGIRWSRMMSTFISYGFSRYRNTDNRLNENEQTPYFTDYRIRDILFYQTDFTSHAADIILSLEPGSWGIINLDLLYGSRKAVNAVYFSGSGRNEFSSNLEFRVKVY